MAQVELERPETMNLLGLILKSILERNLKDRDKARRVEDFSGRVGVKAGGMEITLACDGGRMVIHRGLVGPLGARVSGGLQAFLNIALGGGLAAPVMTGAVRIRGNPLVLLRLLPLLRVPEERP